jgi:hypothetical protein
MRRNEMAILHWLFVLASAEVMARSIEDLGLLGELNRKKVTTRTRLPSTATPSRSSVDDSRQESLRMI